GKGLLSDFNALLSPVTAAGQTAGDVAADLTANRDFGDKVDTMAQLAVPLRVPKLPGRFARFGEKPPVAADVAPPRAEPRLLPEEAPPAATPAERPSGVSVTPVQGDPFKDAPPPGEAPMAPRRAPAASVTPVRGNPFAAAEAEPAPAVASDPLAPERAPQGLGADAAVDVPELPETPSRDTVTDQEDRFHSLRTNAEADKVEMKQRIEDMPEEMKNPETLKRMFRFGEQDPTAKLSPREQELFDTHIKPIRDEMAQLNDEIKSAGFSADDVETNPDGYMHRMVKGKSPQFDRLAGEASTGSPITGFGKMAQSTSAVKDRVFFAIEDARGNRKLVARDNLKGGLTVVEKDRPGVPLPGTAREVNVGDKFKGPDGKEWTFKNAFTREIEANTKLNYYQNAIANMADGLMRMRA
ncbi:MAG: hypothetical protein KGI52_17475, partial [Burkholderiales bacterium]|nr:hypothetical protein [Burkholderiales bacterium]